MAETNTTGRPALTADEIDVIFRKLEPYLRSGLSVHKACLESGVPKSTVYDLMEENTIFAEKIETAKQFMSIAISNVVMEKLRKILRRQELTKDDPNKDIDKDDLEYIKWLALNSKSTKGEFGARTELMFDPMVEIRKLNKRIEEASNGVEYDEIDQTDSPDE